MRSLSLRTSWLFLAFVAANPRAIAAPIQPGVLTAVDTRRIASGEKGFPTGLLANDDRFGRSFVGIGDLDGDGIRDLAVGTPNDADGTAFAAAVYTLFLNSNGTVKGSQKTGNRGGSRHPRPRRYRGRSPLRPPPPFPAGDLSRNMRQEGAIRRAVTCISAWALMTAALLGPPGGRAAATEAVEPLPAQAHAAIDRATAAIQAIATEGGWVWRYSLDLAQRAGESRATPTMIWVQPPGTPTVGMALVRAHAATGDGRHLDAAKAAADALARGQLASGGWDYSIDFDPERSRRVYRRTDIGVVDPAEAARRFNVTTFDDDTTQSAIRFLLAVIDADPAGDSPRDRRIRAACDHALATLLAAQYPGGGWPQRYDGSPRDPAAWQPKRATIPAEWPREWPQPAYQWFATLNDDALRDCVGVLLDAHRRRGGDAWLTAARRAGDFLVAAQLPEPQAGWAQQYDEALHPAWARAFEPPAVASRETAGAMLTLVDLFAATGDERFLVPLPPAVAWLERSAIADGRWARYYELGTNRPLYGDRDGRIRYALAEISEERRKGYGWEGAFGIPEAIRATATVLAAGPQAGRPRSAKPSAASAEKRAAAARALEPRVTEVIAALDDDGRWITRGRFTKEVKGLEFGDRIETATFVTNLNLLSAYLEAVR